MSSDGARHQETIAVLRQISRQLDRVLYALMPPAAPLPDDTDPNACVAVYDVESSLTPAAEARAASNVTLLAKSLSVTGEPLLPAVETLVSLNGLPGPPWETSPLSAASETAARSIVAITAYSLPEVREALALACAMEQRRCPGDGASYSRWPEP